MTNVDSRWVAWAQWLALLTMTLDHLVRHLLGPGSALAWWPESLGRLAFPLFAAMVAWHGGFTSRDPLRYARRILLIGILAQWPYALMPRPEAPYLLNVCFTLAAGLAWAHWAKGALPWTHPVVRGASPWAHGERGALARDTPSWAHGERGALARNTPSWAQGERGALARNTPSWAQGERGALARYTPPWAHWVRGATPWAHGERGALARNTPPWAHGERGALARNTPPWAGLALSLVLWWALGFWVEFGHAGLALVPALMLALSQQAASPAQRGMASLPALNRREVARAQRWMASLPALVVVALLNPGLQASLFALAGVALALAMAAGGLPRLPWPLPRWLWRAWYPGHFALLALLLWD
ncbi:TraX family protein [Halomonas salifodinae]|uniref:TraX family protein n=1 Tax=Halomonas salifodinae TaxID=438745 RepID=A0ABW2EUV6_9GAMM